MNDNVTQNRFADLASLLIAYESFISASLYKADSRDLKDLTAHTKVGRKIIIRFKDQIYNGINQYLVVVESMKVRGIKARIRRYKKLVKNPNDVVTKSAEVYDFVGDMVKWLNSRTVLLNEIFDARPRSVIMSLASKPDSLESYTKHVHDIAKLPALSGLRVIRNWTQKAAALLGEPLSEFESIQSDVETAQVIGSEIGKAQRNARIAKPNSPKAKKAKSKVKKLEQRVVQIAVSSQNPNVVLLASAQAAAEVNYTQQTQIGRETGLSKDQEEALLVEGLSIIAAGAGSGKTRVLAGKVVHHARDEGVPISNIIATSFSKKSASELKERIKAYGVDPGDLKNIGTTHSLGRSILSQFDPEFRPVDSVLSPSDQSKLVRIAMAQVRMTSSRRSSIPRPDESMFPAIKAKGGSGVQTDPSNLRSDEEFQKAVKGATGYWKWMADKNYSVRMNLTLIRKEIGRGSNDVLNYLNDISRRDVSSFSSKEKAVLNEIFGVSKVYGRPINYRIAKQMFEDEEFLREFERQLKEASNSLDLGKEASGRRTQSNWYKQSANQWFNLGWPLVVLGSNGKPQKVGPKRFSTAFSKFVGKMESVGYIYDQYINGVDINSGYPYKEPKKGLSSGEVPPPFLSQAAAVYGAYNWLKSNALEFNGKIDFSDMLVRSVALMKHNPEMLDSLKSRYSHILVDEAQDLNQLQHTMFGLIAGYLDPSTLQPYSDKRLNAKVYALIGDDKQAIYAFRGADPEEFIRRSDLGDVKGDFDTVVLETNYRSGGMIVGAANNLISHNVIEDPLTRKEISLQIPMVCNVLASNENKGVIEAVPVKDPSQAAEQAALSIQALLASGYTLGESSEKPTFGIALRTNAEAYAYCVALIKKGIPFRSKVDVFGNFTTKALLRYLQLSTSNDLEDLNSAVISLHRTPDFKLGTAFEKALRANATDNYYDWLLKNWKVFPFSGRGARWKRGQLGRYVTNLKMVREVFSSYDPEAFLEAIFRLEGTDGDFNPITFKNSLIEYIKQNEDEMDMLSQESTSDTGEVSDVAVAAKAMSPVKIIEEILIVYGSLKNAVAFIKKLQSLNDKSSKKDGSVEPAVLIGTAHGWKGLECEFLYTQMAEGMFPSVYSLDDPYALAQERRLAYVTITRGKEQVTIYSPEESNTGTPLDESQFIAEACIPGLVADTFSKTSADDKVMRYVKEKAEEIKKEQPSIDEGQAFAIAWSIYCKYKKKELPDTEGHCNREPSDYFTGD